MSLIDTPKTPGDIFEGSLKLEDCLKPLLSCLRNLEKDVKYAHKLALSNNNNQIKGEKELADFSQSVKFMSDNFDEFEKERQKQKKVIEEYEMKFLVWMKNLTVLLNRRIGKSNNLDEMAFWSMGLLKEIRKTDARALEIFKETLYIELTQRDPDLTHQTDKNDISNQRTTPVIVKFFGAMTG